MSLVNRGPTIEICHFFRIGHLGQLHIQVVHLYLGPIIVSRLEYFNHRIAGSHLTLLVTHVERITHMSVCIVRMVASGIGRQTTRLKIASLLGMVMGVIELMLLHYHREQTEMFIKSPLQVQAIVIMIFISCLLIRIMIFLLMLLLVC